MAFDYLYEGFINEVKGCLANSGGEVNNPTQRLRTSDSGWYRVGILAPHEPNTTAFARIIIGGGYFYNNSETFLVEFYCKEGTSALRQPPAQGKPNVISQVRTVKLGPKEFAIDVYKPSEYDNEFAVTVFADDAVFTSAGLVAKESSVTASATVYLSKDGYLSSLDPSWLSSAVSISKGGTGATTASAARTKLGVPSKTEFSDLVDAVAALETRVKTLESGNSGGDSGSDSGSDTGGARMEIRVGAPGDYGEAERLYMGEGVEEALLIDTRVPTMAQMLDCYFDCWPGGESSACLNSPTVVDEFNGYWIKFGDCSETYVNTYHPQLVVVPKSHSSGATPGVYIFFEAVYEALYYVEIDTNDSEFLGGNIVFPEA